MGITYAFFADMPNGNSSGADNGVSGGGGAPGGLEAPGGAGGGGGPEVPDGGGGGGIGAPEPFGTAPTKNGGGGGGGGPPAKGPFDACKKRTVRKKKK